jgi:peptidyl-prolyl cis-trans isomerase A (cyclophilin A)
MKNINNNNFTLRLATLFVAAMLAACGADSENVAQVTEQPATPAAVSMEPALVPLPGMENSVPALTEKTTVLMRTTSGDITIEIYPQAAPNAAARFIELVEAGFYNNTPVFRVVTGFVAQFGINWRGDYPAWQDNNFNDDPVLFSHERGTLAFAKAGPNTNSTQVFINYTENNRLAAPNLNFTVFGAVVDGMDAVEAFIPVGDPGGGLDQGRLWEDGGVYLESLATQPVMIESASVVSRE